MDPSLLRSADVTRYDSAWLVLIVLTLAFGGIFLGSLAWALTFARRARAGARAESAGTVPAGDAVVRGVVERDPDDAGTDAPVRLEIEQTGTESQYKGQWRVSWEETGRRTSARPFVLRTADGARVRVEPDARTRLVDDLETLAVPRRGSRVRGGSLDPGETAVVVGVLSETAALPTGEQGYRSAGRAFLLRPPGLGRMLISTAGLVEPHAKRARFYARWALASALLLVLTAGLMQWHFWSLLTRSRHAELTLVRRWSTRVRVKNGYRTDYYAAAALTDRVPPAELAVEVSRDAFTALAVTEGDTTQSVRPGIRAPFLLVGDGTGTYQMGTQPGTYPATAGLSLMILVFTSIVFAATAIAARPWYERIELSEQESGRLPAA